MYQVHHLTSVNNQLECTKNGYKHLGDIVSFTAQSARVSTTKEQLSWHRTPVESHTFFQLFFFFSFAFQPTMDVEKQYSLRFSNTSLVFLPDLTSS